MKSAPDGPHFQTDIDRRHNRRRRLNVGDYFGLETLRVDRDLQQPRRDGVKIVRPSEFVVAVLSALVAASVNFTVALATAAPFASVIVPETVVVVAV
jgi:hypothetical protein